MESKNVNIGAVPQIAFKILFSPSGFFRAMPRNGGFSDPLVFMVTMGCIAGVVRFVLGILRLDLSGGVASIIIMPVMMAFFGFISAAIVFLIWKLMGSQESYETAYRCTAYIAALSPITTILGIIPYFGSVIAIALTTFFLVAASVGVHGLVARKAWLVFGILGVILALASINSESASKRLLETSQEMRKAAGQMPK